MRLRLTKTEGMILIRILPFFVPLGLVESSRVLYIGWYLFLGGIMLINLLQFFYNFKLGRHSQSWRLMVYLGLYVLAQCYSTISYGGNWSFTLFKAIYMVLLCISVQGFIDMESKAFLRVLEAILLISICISTGCEIIGSFNPNGSYVSVYISLPIWMTLRIWRNIRHDGKRDYLPFILSVVAAVTTIVIGRRNGETTGGEWTFFVELLVICGVYYGRGFLLYIKKILNPTILFGSIVFLNLVFVVFQNYSQIGIIKFILVDIMHKDVTFTGRTGIWNLAIRIIAEEPIFGYGEGMGSFTAGDYWTNFIVHSGAHNQFLQIMLFGGIVSLVFYLLAWIEVWKALQNASEWSSIFLTMGFFAILIEFTFVYRNLLICTPLFILMMIAVNLKKINENAGGQKIK